jgi:hypothetical protein
VTSNRAGPPRRSFGNHHRLSTAALVGWLSAAIAVTLAGAAIVARRPFDAEPHAWLSAHFATMARAFVEEGIVALRGVPIQNHAPLGVQPDAYIHWPPLFPIVLSAVFRWFGESEPVARTFMLLITAAFCMILFALVRSVYSARAAIISVFGFLVLPVTVVFGRTVLHLPLALSFHVLAVLAFVRAVDSDRVRRGWAATGLVAMALAVLSSWEPILAGVGLLVVSLLHRSGAAQRLSFAYLAVGAIAMGAVLFLYVHTYPFLLTDLWHTVLFRVGRGFQVQDVQPVHAFVNEAVYAGRHASPSVMITTLVDRHLDLGATFLVAMAGVIAFSITGRSERKRRVAMLSAGLFAPWLLWLLFMSNHAVFHEYELMIVAPFAAASLGIGLAAVIDFLESSPADSLPRSFSWLGFVVVPAVLMAGAIQQWRAEVLPTGPPSGLIEYATEIEAATPEDAVVLTPDVSMVPVYYARRHLIRGIISDATVERVRQALPVAFPGSPVYLALTPDREAEFSRALRTLPVVRRTPHLVLLTLGASGSG